MSHESSDKEGLEILIGKAVSDPDFRQDLVSDPLKAVDNAGIELTADQRTTLVNFDRDELTKLATEVDQRISRSVIGLTPDDNCNGYASGGSCQGYVPVHVGW